MSSNNKDNVSKRHDQRDLYNSTHKYDDRSKYGEYGEYLPHDAEPQDRLKDTKNLFHDSNSENGKWLKLARTHIFGNK